MPYPVQQKQSVIMIVCLVTHILCFWLVKRPVTGEKGFGKFGGGVQGLPLWSMYPERDGKIARIVAVSRR